MNDQPWLEPVLKTALTEKSKANARIEKLYASRISQSEIGWRIQIVFLYAHLFFWRSIELLVESGVSTLIERIGVGIHKRLFISPVAPVNPEIQPWLEAKLETPGPLALLTSATPKVSIIIPVYNKFIYTFNCLNSLKKAISSGFEFEVIVVDDASTDQTSEGLQAIEGIRILRNQTNRGFIRSCNDGASQAKGEFICFLNNDTRVLPNWLESLMQLIEADPLIGAVGSKLIYPDGRLQEAGGIIWQDATGWNYGRLQSPDEPEYNYVRPVDYCSAASLLVRAHVFRELGGFSETFLPAYYEDTDLCFSIRKAGYQVFYQPQSQLIHYEGITSGTDISSGIKQYQEVNRSKFLTQWQHELQLHLTAEASNAFRGARRLRPQPTILIVDSYVPLYDKESGCYRIFNIIQILLELGYSVIFCPDNGYPEEPYTSELQQMGVEVLYCTPRQPNLKQLLRDRLFIIDIAWICRPELCSKYSELIRQNPQIKIIYDTVDLHFLRLKRQLEISPASETDPNSWKRVQDVELKMAQSAQVTLVVTEAEKEILTNLGVTNVQVIPNIHQPYSDSIRGYGQRSSLLFIGSYNHPPNVDAVMWLCHEIMPIIWQTHPDLSVTLLGSNVSPEVLALTESRIQVPGYIADVEPYFLSHRVFVAPLRYGAGMKGKVGQSLSYGLPVVTTSIGAEGIGLEHGVNAMIADDVAAFAQSVITLYDSERVWSELSQNSQALIERYSPSTVKQQLRSLMKPLI